MKVFLSWSGNESKQLAGFFKDWLPNVLQYIDPYMSAQDIALGERWNNSIIDNLKESVFGLVFVTPSNINAPWINYEAGALSKTFDSKVVPILYNTDVLILNDGPLKQFQSAKNVERESILSLVKSINDSNKDGKLDELRLEKTFEMWWPSLEGSISNIDKEETDQGIDGEKGPTEKELLSVIYSKITEQGKLLIRNQDNNAHLPRVYSGVLRDLKIGYEKIQIFQKELIDSSFQRLLIEDLSAGLVDLERAIEYLNGNPSRLEPHMRSEPSRIVGSSNA